MSFKKILRLECFTVGSREGLFDCEIPKDALLVQKRHTKGLCSIFYSVYHHLFVKRDLLAHK